jgi:hypothetical protein
MHEVPGHEHGVALSELVLGPARTLVEVRRAGPGLADPPGVGLRRDDAAEVLEGVEERISSTCTPCLRMIDVLTLIRPAVLDTSGERLSVQLM